MLRSNLRHVTRYAIPLRVSQASHRLYATTSEPEEDSSTPGSNESSEGSSASAGSFEPESRYEKWLNEDGARFRDPNPDGPNWLKEDHPFPLNPSFRPPPPIHHSVRRVIYQLHTTDPSTNTVPKLSSRFGLSHKRVEAIIRLRALEESWGKDGDKKQQLQTGFLHKMQLYLGARSPKWIAEEPTHTPESLAKQSVFSPRPPNVTSADFVDESQTLDGGSDNRHTRMFWEPVDPGEEAILPYILEEERKHGLDQKRAKAAAEKRDEKVVTDSSHVPIRFIDVGLKFLSSKVERTRSRSSQRRHDQNLKRRVQ